MSIRRMMFFSLGAKIKNLIEAFKTRVFAQQGEFEAEICLDATLTNLDNKGVLDSASLVVTPNGYKEGLLFNVVPSDGRNILLQTQNFNTAPWIKLQNPNVTVVENAAIAPDGTNTASLITSNTTTTDRGIRQTVTIEPNTSYRLSFWARSTNSAVIRADVSDLNPQEITLTSTWTRYTINGSYNLSYAYTSQFVDIVFGSNQLSKTFELWGAQLEVGTVVTEYQANTTTRGGFQVTRATTGTRVDADGLIEVVPYNLLQRSEEFDNDIWAKTSGSSVIPNTTTAPNGTLNADTINLVTQSESRVTQGTFSIGNLTSYTASCYFKNISLLSGQTFNFRLSNVTASPNNFVIIATVDLFNGTVVYSQQGTNITGITGIGSASIQSVGNDWYRVIITGTTGTSAATNVGSFQIINSTARSFYAWGAQLVTGTQAKDYFPTTNRQNVPRIDYSNGSCPSILVEPQSTNQIRNNTMTGAVVGNPGTLPTNWSQSLIGTSREVVGLGIENGVNYIDVRISGTAGGAGTALQRFVFETTTQIAATTGQTWTLSNYVKVIAQPLPPTNYRFVMFEFTSVGGFVKSTTIQNITPTTTLQRFSFTRTLSGGETVARVQPIFEFDTVTGQAYDFTIRIGMPQMEQQSVATSIIPTSSGAVTRNADVITNTNATTLIGQTEGSVYAEVNIKELVTSKNIFQLSFDGSNRFGIQDTGTSTRVLVLSNQFTGTTFNFTRLSVGLNKVCLVYTNGLWKVFRNGVLSAQQANGIYTSPLTTINVGAGGSPLLPSDFLNGGIQELVIYKTALTDAQAIQLTTL